MDHTREGRWYESIWPWLRRLVRCIESVEVIGCCQTSHIRGRGFSQAFYRAELFKELGFEDLESFMTGFWESWACSKGNPTQPRFNGL